MKDKDRRDDYNQERKTSKRSSSTYTPQQLAVIFALVANTMHVHGVFIDVDQNVEVVLKGNLKKSVHVQRILEGIGDDDLDDLISALQTFNDDHT
ncbi:hypothetical protein [Texcoconibacillus texcoconensis]|uniref:Uncharacterized protein n=1 Tax=Texcoconibacillus texcoconensis TaxID=1095777 RepID=A0A840QNG6_9BACI|nr:hypothetical protein [Texcoconibacillus texcoconensis]MBB5172926.1 hypothetical protein [Texcoconibacillus texcoconensis]